MDRIGIIGLGSMGTMIANGLLSSGTIPQEDLIVFTHTLRKAEVLRERYAAIRIGADNSDVVLKSDIVFVCVPPNQIKPVLLEIKNAIGPDMHLVSLAAYVSLGHIGSIFDGQVSKVIPSFASEVNEGVFLTCHNNKVTDAAKARLDAILAKLGAVYEIDESQFEIYSDITSCSPGIFSSIFSEFIRSAGRHGNIDAQRALEMFVQTLYGLSKLYKEKRLGFDETIARVARKGGITEIGISVVNDKAPALFDEIFETTLAKHEMRKREFDEEYS